MIKVTGYLNPAIFTNITGDTFAVSGANRIQVPKGTEYKDIHWVRRIVKPNQPKTYHFTSTRNQSLKYKVSVFKNSMQCDCPGFLYRRACKHINLIKKQVA